ncbi:MAG: aminotransferase class I/II-fold pyridoxal phosphate-dependent enzyme [SAR202 cluster bacterium]|jgi:histidinol-phosphate aminotransferase|nr:histidinol-phosphate transaminase [Acidobacteriota bacterium]MBU81862.1 histidinol-phosphate transaminase [Chloroflexota bacterium]MDP6372540.1 histidinol-phosphate transaminase [Vicinamibacterales bacterium]MDP6800055.1 histidinol-phosphate transaminase [SAR202 cluster bacterium]MDP7339818.1 histidinol-phosphate transaminase [Vicinamibacterales bacterium]|tara:strand:- start:8204 stop:9304 length:1101 start_codon:yes stop_codon:yes gene_type:complete
MSSLEPKSHIAALPLYPTGASRGTGTGTTIKLSSNESAFGPSPDAERVYRDLTPSLNRYPEAGDNELRAAIAEVHDIEPEGIFGSNGADHVIYLLLSTYAGPGDEVVVSQHGFFRNTLSVRACGATPVVANELDYTTSVDAMLAAVTDRTRVVLLANPNNPTGTYVSTSDLQRLADGLPSNVLLIVDSAYAEYVRTPDYSAGMELVQRADHVAMTRTFSKAYGLAGLRLAWAYGSRRIVDAYTRARLPYPVSRPAQAVGVAALRDRAHLERVVEQNARGLVWVRERLDALGLHPFSTVTNFNTCRFGPPGSGAATRAVAFLAARNILVRPLAPAGLPDFVRITVGLEEENRALIDGVSAFLEADAS